MFQALLVSWFHRNLLRAALQRKPLAEVAVRVRTVRVPFIIQERETLVTAEIFIGRRLPQPFSNTDTRKSAGWFL